MHTARKKRKISIKHIIRLALLTLICVLPENAAAESSSVNTQPPGNAYLRENYSYRFDTLLTYEHLSPDSEYGDWYSGDVALYAKVHPNVTAYGQLSHHSRENDGDGQLAVAGAYVDWRSWLSTYTAISYGLGDNFLPNWRFDQDFRFPVAPFLFTIGASYIDYEGPQKDWLISAGASWYHHRWITEYRLFKNTSDPGSVDSYTHLFSVGYGEDGWRWIFFKLSLGGQAYQTTTLAEPQDVRQDAYEISLSHRHWIGKDWGLMEKAGFLSLDSGYDKYSLSIGFFKEF